ncbi:hypothetical protein CHU98_g6350 [Xylaria longipes]|nr:hypothetical protein CHU98_g6350 [Xylaria longipes]
MREMMAETKVTLAAHQLSEQVKESKWLWGNFRDEYSTEVKSIKLYVGVDILQQIWRKKVASKDKYKRGGKEDDQFDVQTMKLESCLNQLDEATQLLADAWSLDRSSDYDSRQHHLAKMRATGNLVVGLSKRALTNEAACIDLLGELAELEKLIDPKSPAASMLHRYDKHQSQNTTRSGKTKTESSSSNRPENGDTNNQAEHESNDWQERNEHENSNWNHPQPPSPCGYARREGPASLMPIIGVMSREVLTDRPVEVPAQGKAQVRLKRTPNFSRAGKCSLCSEEHEAGELLRLAQLICLQPGNTALMRTMLEGGKEEEERRAIIELSCLAPGDKDLHSPDFGFWRPTSMAKTYRDLDPADFPQLWQRPSFEDLLTCLNELHIEPRVWTSAASEKTLQEGQENTARYRRDVISYLATIVGSALRWLKDDEQREAIWDAASHCLSQRCGRAGMGEITRRWPFQNRQVPFELTVREPPITGDSLGHKTWGSSFLMAQLLDSFKSKSLPHLLTSGRRESTSVLELGSGTGLLGIATAAMWQVEVVLSDLPDIMPNLDYNIEQNRAIVERLGGSIILASDGIYDEDHPELLSSAIHENLLDSAESRAIVMVPLRDQITKRLIAKFRSSMNAGTLPLIALEEHVLTGQDDWGDDDDSQAVECWWAIFGKQQA